MFAALIQKPASKEFKIWVWLVLCPTCSSGFCWPLGPPLPQGMAEAPLYPSLCLPQLPPEGMFGFHAQYSGCKPNIKTSAGCLGASEGGYQRNLFLQRKRNQQSLCLGMFFSSSAVHTSNNFRHRVFLLLSPFLISIALFHYNKY